jgi:hypothetical protein
MRNCLGSPEANRFVFRCQKREDGGENMRGESAARRLMECRRLLFSLCREDCLVCASLAPLRSTAGYSNPPFSEACFKNTPKKRITLSPTGSLFLTHMIRITHLTTSALNSSSSNSSCASPLPFFPPFLPVSGGSKQHASCIFLRLTTSFRCVAVVLCASLKTCAICVRSEVTGPSSGISTAFEDCLAEDARVDFVVPVLDLRVVDVVDARGVRVEGRPGIFAISLTQCRVVWLHIECCWCCCLLTPAAQR